ncbi:SusC/RagA family TonB-linked outer membrane protein [Desertivirga brevis]|uniref:SusC/RagA family TonB-linked outer membrane protein n=1 Tax=Desertivirga brevis TaxID=2810310 RepID=UPI001A96C46D|nr:SusC/RagA family TonB-linked outer membrane protein [Pedobacter sp. SYSU D00873]
MMQTFTGFMKVLYVAALLSVLHLQSLYAQSKAAVTGIVRSQNDEKLPGVNVKAINTSNGKTYTTSTDVSGNFAFSNLPNGGPYNFSFSFIGFEPMTLTGYNVDQRSQISLAVSLKESNSVLSQVVVTGYGTSSKADITGAVTTIKPEEFNQGVVSSPAQLLQGKVAGLNITRSGDPNSKGSVILRGPSTLLADAQEPFYVIDGVPGASIDLIAPDDIMSIDVLKDAASTAIYGSRAANGVIQITTRRAKNGQSRLYYSGYAASENVSNRIEMLTGDELRAYLAANNKSQTPNDNTGANTNWQDEVSRTGISQNHNVSFNGNSGGTAYSASMNYLDNNGIMKGSSMDRMIIRANVEQKAFKENLRLNLTATNSITNRTDIPALVYQNMLNYLPTVDIKNADGTYREDFSRTRNYLNPVSLIENNDINSKTRTFLGNILAEVKLLPGLRYTFSGSMQDEQNTMNVYNNRFSGLAQGLNGQGIRGTEAITKRVLESYFNYDKTFNRHGLKLLAGYSWQQDKPGDGFQISNTGFVTDALTYNNLALGDNYRNASIQYGDFRIMTVRLISYYGRLNYNYDNKYLLQASLRRDGSSAFGKNNSWGYFPAFSAGWRITKEKFMQNQNIFDELKLRGGYGVSGNSLGFNAFTKVFLYAPQKKDNGEPIKFYYDGRFINSIGPYQNDNPDLKWEKTAMADVGLDISILKGKVNASVDLYDKRTSDLIWNYRVSTTQYFVNNLTANAGEVSNRGIEVMLRVSPFSSKQFKWNSSMNFSHNTNKVESLSNDKFTLSSIPTAYLGGKGQSTNSSQIVTEGLPIGSFNIYRYAGKDEKGVTQMFKTDGTLTTAPTSADFSYAGNAQPKFMYGWNNSFSYRNFDLNFFLRGVYGNKVLNATLAGLNNPGDATTVNIPRFTLNESAADNNAYLISDRFLENGSYLRMDNATLGYTFTSPLKSLSKMRIYTTANNLFVITKYRGIDPEVNMGGLEPGIDNNNYYPKTRSFLLGLNVTF